jgi:F-type H+-transporting ATPase subunit b
VSPTVTASSNFLIPNGTFIAELIGFIVMLFLIGRYIVPPINKAMTARQDQIRKQFQDADDAKTRLEAAEAEYREQLAAVERIHKSAEAQLAAERSRTIAALRSEIGSLAVELAGRIVGESLEDEARQSRVVERFLAELESR